MECGQVDSMNGEFIFWSGVICAGLTVLILTGDFLEAFMGMLLYVFLLIISTEFDKGEKDKGGENGRY